jgi:hypothetical protein
MKDGVKTNEINITFSLHEFCEFQVPVNEHTHTNAHTHTYTHITCNNETEDCNTSDRIRIAVTKPIADTILNKNMDRQTRMKQLSFKIIQ